MWQLGFFRPDHPHGAGVRVREIEMAWTQFWDMSSGGREKEPWGQIFIEAPEEEAKRIFYARFGHNPERITCACCGGDYSISETETLEEATAYHRSCQWDEDEKKYIEAPDARWGKPYTTLEQYVQQDDVKVIRADEITEAERSSGEPPAQGWVWAG